MKQKKKKLTYHQMLGVMDGMSKEIEYTRMFIMNIDQLLNHYFAFKKETDTFKTYLDKELKKQHDKDNKETKEK
jgi:ATP-dependent protease ClpP protease subunit